MTVYKLHYFNLRGRAEVCRLIFAYANVPYEDIRFEGDKWPEIKPTMPFRQAPILEVDGKILAQSNAMARYLARKFNLAGKDEWEQALADQYVDCIEDLIGGWRKATFEKDEEKQRELFEKYLSDEVMPHAEIIEKHLKGNGTGYLVGASLTWADLAYFAFFTGRLERFPDILKDLPHLKELVSTVRNIPQIKKWIEIRPKTRL